MVNSKFYIGMHGTDNLEDGYIGSGKRLWYSINKYGRENFTFEILEHLPNREELIKREKELVNEDFLKNPLCLNLMIGGKGGFISIEQQKNRSQCGGRATSLKLKSDPIFREKRIKIASDNFKRAHREGKIKYNTFEGRSHSENTKKKMSESKKGKTLGLKNSQYGTCWITNEKENKKIKKGDLIPNGWRLGRKIKKEDV